MPMRHVHMFLGPRELILFVLPNLYPPMPDPGESEWSYFLNAPMDGVFAV